MSNDPFTQFSLSLPKFPEAKCASSDFDPDLWFPQSMAGTGLRAEDTAVPKTLCGQCIHQVECLQFALDNRIRDGIWGGLLPQERKAEQALESKNAIRQDKLDLVREHMAQGLSLRCACSKAGIAERTFYQYQQMERLDWPSQLSNQKTNRTKAKEKK
jgi:hypothetical protein